MDDRDIIELFFARSEAAIAETDKKYGGYCRYIAYQLLCDREGAEEVVNDTYLKVWNTIPPNRPEQLKHYVGMISRQLSLNACKYKNAPRRGGGLETILGELSECIPDATDGDVGESVALKDALNRFVRSLPEKHRKIFVRRYWYTSSVEEIAREYGMRESHVGVLLFRTRKKLKRFLEKEGFSI